MNGQSLTGLLDSRLSNEKPSSGEHACMLQGKRQQKMSPFDIFICLILQTKGAELRAAVCSFNACCLPLEER